LVKRERKHGRVPLTNGGVIAQVWRGGNGKQVPVARLLASVDVVPVDDELDLGLTSNLPAALHKARR
jgi:hypothetical protein